jgi:transposase InsO family protein
MTDMPYTKSQLETAHFRFALIAPVIQNTFTDSSKMAYYRRVTEKPLTRPDGSAFTFNPKTLQCWERCYRVAGMDGLLRRPRGDKGTPRVLSDAALAEIFRLREKYPRLNATQIHARLVNEAFCPATVSVRSVQRLVKSQRLKTGDPIGGQKDRKAFEEPFFGAMFQADTCYMPYLAEDGKKRRPYLVMILDDHSRLIVAARCFYQDNAYNFQQVLKQAVATYGVPDKLYVDNGSPYANQQLEWICGAIGTILIHTPVRDGAAKGKVERAFRSLKERWLYALDISQIHSLAEFNLSLADAVRKHNLAVNTNTGQTPMDRFLASNHQIRQPASPQWLESAFMNRVERKVNQDATLSVNHQLFDAPIPFIGQKVQVRFLPARMEDAYILHDGEAFPLRLTDKPANARAKRRETPMIDYALLGGGHHV